MSNKNLFFMIMVILTGFLVMMLVQTGGDYTDAESFESASSVFESVLRSGNVDTHTQ